MIEQIKPQKGKAFDKLPKKTLSTFETTKYIQSIKYDGNQIFILKEGRTIRFFTSDWKQFHLEAVAAEVKTVHGNFMLVGEFMHGCLGKLGDRRKSAILTTYRTNYNKGIENIGLGQLDTNIMVFDALEIKQDTLIINVPYKERLRYVMQVVGGMKYLNPVIGQEVNGATAILNSVSIIARGWEGTMLVEADSHYHLGKRVNHSIKLKSRLTADLRCIDTELGDGKYANLIGSLTLQDSTGRVVSVGSGLSDADRNYHEDYYIGKVVEIEYEQILDTYIQPTFIRVREEKEID